MTDDRAVLIGSNVVSFGSGVSAADSQDLMDLMTYAELRADRRYSRVTLPKSWLDHYQRTLVKYGCQLRGFLIEDYSTASSLQELLELTVRLVGGDGGVEFSRLVKRSLLALDANKEARRYLSATYDQKNGMVFEVTPCHTNAMGQTYLFFCGLRLRFDTYIEQEGIWNEAIRYVTLIPNGGYFLFDRQVYAQHRAYVLAKIDRISEQFFKELALQSGS